MNITFTFEDVSHEEATSIEKLIDHMRYVDSYKGGENVIRTQVLKLAETLDAEMNDILFSNEGMSFRSRGMYKLIWSTIDQLREIGKGE